MINLTKTAVRLGDSAFDEERKTFFSVDVDNLEKELFKEGADNGKNNFPDSHASQPDAVESKVIEKITQTAQQTKQALNQHFVGFNSRLLPISETEQPAAVIDRIRQRKNEMQQALDARSDKYKRDSIIKRGSWQDAQEAYNKFREENNITRSASYLPLKSIIAFFALIIVVESALNASLLWELIGAFLAFGQTVLITSVNVMFGAALVGLLFRYKNLGSQKRWLALISIPVSFLVLAFNLGVGHYRDAVIEAKAIKDREDGLRLSNAPDWETFNYENIDNNFVDHTQHYAQQAMDRIINSPLDLDSVLSVLFIIVGIGFFGFAAYKWYSMFDPYPGYGKLDKEREKRHKSYNNLKSTVRKEMEQVIQVCKDRARDERDKAINMRMQRADLINRAKRLKEGYRDWIRTLNQQQNRLLKLYRDSNRQARSEPPPEYFSKDIPIDKSLSQPPAFAHRDKDNIEMVVEVVEETMQEIDRIEREHWKRFENELEMHNS